MTNTYLYLMHFLRSFFRDGDEVISAGRDSKALCCSELRFAAPVSSVTIQVFKGPRNR